MKSKIKILLNLPFDIWLLFITYFPGPIGFLLRYKFWRKRLKYLGEKTKIDMGVYFKNPKYISIDNNCWIDKNVSILAGLDNSKREKIVKKNKEYTQESGLVYIGKNVHIASNCILSGIDSGIYIGNNSSIAAGSKLFAFSHHYRSKRDANNIEIYFSPLVEHDKQTLIKGPIYIAENVGIALDSIILPGVIIHKNSFVLPKSVLLGGEFNENSLISGNPAKNCGNRFNNYNNKLIKD